MSSKTGVYIFPPIDLKYTKLQKKGFKIYLRKSINFKFNIHPCKKGWVGVGGDANSDSDFPPLQNEIDEEEPETVW